MWSYWVPKRVLSGAGCSESSGTAPRRSRSSRVHVNDGPFSGNTCCEAQLCPLDFQTKIGIDHLDVPSLEVNKTLGSMGYNPNIPYL